jgi:flagellar motor switch/type III secretory pathway protein FliN
MLERTDGRLRGEVVLCVSGSSGYALRCRWEGGEAISAIARADRCAVPIGRAKEIEVDERSEQELLQATADAPVEVSVEIARFELKLEQLASIAPGEVIVSGVRIGERAVLRAGKHVIALGELVDVDGEIGVRVLERLEARSPATRP